MLEKQKDRQKPSRGTDETLTSNSMKSIQVQSFYLIKMQLAIKLNYSNNHKNVHLGNTYIILCKHITMNTILLTGSCSPE